jgi:hypothetical protein
VNPTPNSVRVLIVAVSIAVVVTLAGLPLVINFSDARNKRAAETRAREGAERAERQRLANSWVFTIEDAAGNPRTVLVDRRRTREDLRAILRRAFEPMFRFGAAPDRPLLLGKYMATFTHPGEEEIGLITLPGKTRVGVSIRSKTTQNWRHVVALPTEPAKVVVSLDSDLRDNLNRLNEGNPNNVLDREIENIVELVKALDPQDGSKR